MEKKRFIAAAAALLIATCASACGKADESEKGGSDTAVSSETEEKESAKTAPADDEKEPETTKKRKSKKTTEASDAADKSDTKTTAVKDSKSSDSGNKSSGGLSGSSGNSSSGGSSGSSGNSSSGGSSGSSGNISSGGSSGSSGNSSSGGSSGSSGNSSSGEQSGGSGNEQQGGQQSGDPQTEENTYTAEITLGGSPSGKGENFTVEGSKVTITSAGDYRFTGSCSDGQIIVAADTEEKVKIVLDGVDLTCTDGPAVFIRKAKKCTVELADGSSNKLSDSAKDKVNDGVIFSNDTLRIKGGGSLEINAGNAHGISSDDDLIIEGGNYVINSIKSGIMAHDDITINGGEFDIKGGTNGIKSKGGDNAKGKGTININGGRILASGGTKEEKSSVYAMGDFNYTGGELYAAGNQVTAPTTYATPYIVVDASSSIIEAGSSVDFILDGTVYATLVPHNNSRCLMMLSPDIHDGASFSVSINGNSSEDFTVSEGQNVFKLS
ncbi:MAG TPA: carbohydrate-binding domain-containing protein [Ruminococcus sp.]|nr:carbohydrate-binding domain-containing protein [Ruminococcus sp.]